MTENDQVKLHEARNSYAGKNLTNSQFDESWAIVGVMEREIRKSGSFREKLTDYSHAYARSEKFDALKGETIIRDIFKSRYGQTMNQMRQGLKEREATLRDAGKDQALHHARSIEGLIKDGETMPFYRAYDSAAVQMAKQHNTTESGAKALMKDAFREVEGKELYETGKALEKTHHEPVRDAAREASREAAKPHHAKNHHQTPSRARM